MSSLFFLLPKGWHCIFAGRRVAVGFASAKHSAGNLQL